MRLRRAVTIAATVALVGGGIVATAASPAQAEARHWLTICHINRVAADDPILLFGQPGASHLHDFAGNRGVSAYSTAASLKGVASDCPTNDRSAYWAPALYQNGRKVTAAYMGIYYENRSENAGRIQPFPEGFQLILGRSTVTTAAATEKQLVWGCSDNTQIGGQTPPANCRSGGIQLRSRFPNCWDGRYTSGHNATGHVRYASGGRCPAGYGINLPTIRMNVAYNLGTTTGRITLSSGGGSIYSKHLDFFNGWDTATLQRLVTQCLNGNGGPDCGTQRGTTPGTAGPPAGGGGGSQPQPPAPGAGAVQGVGSGRCIDVPNGSAVGTQVTLWDCNGGANQRFSRSGDTLRVQGRCLDAEAGGRTAGTAVITWECNGQSNQRWAVNGNGTITSRDSGLCLDAEDRGTASGTPLVLWTCTGGTNQRWRL